MIGGLLFAGLTISAPPAMAEQDSQPSTKEFRNDNGGLNKDARASLREAREVRDALQGDNRSEARREIRELIRELKDLKHDDSSKDARATLRDAREVLHELKDGSLSAARRELGEVIHDLRDVRNDSRDVREGDKGMRHDRNDLRHELRSLHEQHHERNLAVRK
jgi:ribosomal protein L22